MGTWGFGTFSNDTAADYASVFREKLLQEAAVLVAQLDTFKGDDPSEMYPILYNVEILATLAENIDQGPANEFVGLKPEVIAEWKEKFLTFYFASAEEMREIQGDSDESRAYEEKEREAIAATFDRYIAISTDPPRQFPPERK